MRTFEQWFQTVTTVSPDRRERVAQRCFDLEQAGSDRACVWHASHELFLEDLASGVIPFGTCRYCGGRTHPSQEGEHAMCAARVARGVPVTQLDSFSEGCPCAKCQAEVAAERPRPQRLMGCTCGGIGDTGTHAQSCPWRMR